MRGAELAGPSHHRSTLTAVERADLEALAREIGYEVGMMAASAAFHRLRLELERVVSFSLIEACLLHARNLDDFLGKPLEFARLRESLMKCQPLTVLSEV